MFPVIRACNDLELLCKKGQTSTDGACNGRRGSRLGRCGSFGAELITYSEPVASYVHRSRPARPVPILPMKIADEYVSGLNIKPQNDVFSAVEQPYPLKGQMFDTNKAEPLYDELRPQGGKELSGGNDLHTSWSESSIKRRTDSIKSKIKAGVNSRPQSIAFEAESIYEDASGLNIISQDDVYSAVEPYQIKRQMLEKAEPNYE